MICAKQLREIYMRKKYLIIFLVFILLGCEGNKSTASSAVENDSNSQDDAIFEPLPNNRGNLRPVEVVEQALRAVQSGERDQFDLYLDGLGTPKEEMWEELKTNCPALNVDDLSFEELEHHPLDMGENSPNLVWVEVTQGITELGGFDMHRWPDKPWEISKGTIRCISVES